jgi:hypothetical protein
MPEQNLLGRATAGQLRRAGFNISPETTADDATTGFEILASHGDPVSAGEFEKATKRGDHLPPAKGKA